MHICATRTIYEFVVIVIGSHEYNGLLWMSHCDAGEIYSVSSCQATLSCHAILCNMGNVPRVELVIPHSEV